MTDERADVLQRFLALSRLALPLIGILLVVMQWWQNSQLMDEAQSANQTMRQIWTDHSPAFPLDTLAAALYLPTAVSPLGAFDAGDGPWLGQSVWLQLSKLARSQDQLGYDVFPAGRQIGLTAATFAQIMIPSLAVILGWQQVKRSKSRNLQSWTTLQTSVIEFAAPMVAVSCFLTAALQRQSLGVEGAVRLMLILGAYVLYAIACTSICWLCFQTMTSLSRATGLLVIFWLFNFTLARPVSVNLAASIFKLPSIDSYARKLDFESQNGYGGVEPKADRTRRFFTEALRDYKASTPSEMTVNLSAVVMQKEELHQRAAGRRLRGELDEIFGKQERLEQVVSVLFPMVAIQLTSSALSGTDFASERIQLIEADAFWDEVVKKVYDDVIVSSGAQAIKIMRGSDYWRQFPFLDLRVPPPTLALGPSLIPVIGLTLCIMAGLYAAMRSAKPGQTDHDEDAGEEEVAQ